MFTINLVLNVPEVSSSKSTAPGQGAPGKGKRARVQWAIPADQTASSEEQLNDDKSDGEQFHSYNIHGTKGYEARWGELLSIDFIIH